jgi:hypothetical protein
MPLQRARLGVRAARGWAEPNGMLRAALSRTNPVCDPAMDNDEELCRV